MYILVGIRIDNIFLPNPLPSNGEHLAIREPHFEQRCHSADLLRI